MKLSYQQRERLRWSVGLHLCSWAILAVFTIPVLICFYIFNMVEPYNVGDAPQWAYVLLFSWLLGTVGPLTLSALLAMVRCPVCQRFMFLARKPQAKTPVPGHWAFFHAYRHNRVHCSRCGHEYALA